MKAQIWMTGAAALVAMGLGAAATAAVAPEVKLATVDSSRVLKSYYKAAQADNYLQDELDDMSAEVKKLREAAADLKKDFDALKAEAQNKALTEEARGKKKEAAEEKLTSLMEFENKARETLTARRKQVDEQGRRLQKRLVGDIRDAVRTLAASNGLTVVLDAASATPVGLETVIYAQTNFDITESVIQLLNAGQSAVASPRKERRSAVKESDDNATAPVAPVNPTAKADAKATEPVGEKP
ncbi:MAG: OmpH family outer membrane protein [bacterium]